MKTNIFKIIMGFVMVTLLFTACKEEYELGTPPSESAVSFTVTAIDDFNYTITNTSSATGMATWDLGNGTTASGDVVEAYYPVEGNYTVTLTLSGQGGATQKTTEIQQASTDWSFFETEFFTFLTGGSSNTEGKTWMMDAAGGGHYALGPGNGDYTSWFATAPNQKAGFGCYDDEITFILSDFVVKYYTGPDGKALIRQEEYNGKSDYYSNPVDPENAGFEYTVDYVAASDPANPITQNYLVSESNGVYSITFQGAAPVFPAFDPGAQGNVWTVSAISEHFISLTCEAPAAGAGFQMTLIEKGFVRPEPTYEISASEVTGTDIYNTYEFALTDVVIPDGASINTVSWAFGDGETAAGSVDGSVTHTFMQGGTYTITVTVVDGFGTTTTKTVDVYFADDHPDYIFHLGEVVTYHDFDGGAMVGAPMSNGGVDVIATVANPSQTYPNISANVLQLTKSGDWSNGYMTLPGGQKFDLTKTGIFRYKVYGESGKVIRFQLYNKDFAEPWTVYTLSHDYTIKQSNKWETVEIDFGAMVDSEHITDWFDDISIFFQPGIVENITIYIDDIEGPHIPGMVAK